MHKPSCVMRLGCVVALYTQMESPWEQMPPALQTNSKHTLGVLQMYHGCIGGVIKRGVGIATRGWIQGVNRCTEGVLLCRYFRMYRGCNGVPDVTAVYYR
jgi:hypothetical protein